MTAGDALGVTPTPDTGKRLSTARLWDEVARHLIEIHDHLRAELTQIRDLIGQVKDAASAAQARSAINQMTLRQNSWTLGAYCASYCRIVTGHHTLEDQAVFPNLRAAEPGLTPVLDRLADEHKTIHQVLEDVDAALVEHLRSAEGFAGLQEAADILTDVLLSHLAYEEAQLVEPLARHGFYGGQL